MVKILKALNHININASPIINSIYYKVEHTKGGASIKSKIFHLLSQNYQSYHLDSSLIFIQESIKHLSNDCTLKHLSQNPLITQIDKNYYPQYVAIQLLKAELLYRLPINDPRRIWADSSLVLAEQVSDWVMANLKNSYDRIEFVSTIRKITELRLLIEKEKNQIYSGYEAVEQSRSRILHLHYAEQKTNELSRISFSDRTILDSISNTLAQVDIKLGLLQSKNRLSSDEEKEQQLLTHSKIRCEEQRMSILQKIEANIPEYSESVTEKLSFNVENFRHNFFKEPKNTNKVILEYFQTKDSLFLFCLNSSGLKVKSSSISDSIMNILADEFTSTIADSFPNFLRMRKRKKSAEVFRLFINQGMALYQRLIEPWENEIKDKELVIIPDGAIWKIPMESLLAIKTEKERDSLLSLYEDMEMNAYKHLPFLVKNHNIERRMNLTFGSEKLDKINHYDKELIAFAPVFDTQKKETISPLSSLTRSFLNGIRFHSTRSFAIRSDSSGENFKITSLSGSENEVNKIAELITKSSVNSAEIKVYLHTDAHEDQFKKLQNQSVKYIHIATHGFANINQPNLSGLIFKTEKETKNDGILYAGEIQSLKYPSYLVTLSACETGRGRVVNGEGIMGLTYGFMKSGAENVISSYWTVNDRATSIMMTDLYRHLLQGKSPAQALNASQRLMISKGYASPYFWASFTNYRLR